MDKFIGITKGQKVAVTGEESRLKDSRPEKDLEDFKREGVVVIIGTLTQLIKQ
jgi:hypothetical protein